MQQPSGSTEVRLPRAVIRRSAALQARIDARDKPAEPEIPNPVGTAAPALAPAVATTPPADTPPATPVGDPRDADPNYWKQRFNVTSGLLTRERAEITAERGRTQHRITELQGQIETLQSQAPAPKIDIKQFFTDEQIAKYGPEQCEVMAATAMSAARVTAKTLVDAAVQPLKQERQDTQARDDAASMTRFKEQLTELHPGWTVDDESAAWRSWLQEEDETTGQIRQTLLDGHVASRYAAGAARMFKAWKAIAAAAPAAPAPPPPAPPAPPIAPSGRGAAPGPGDAPARAPEVAAVAGYPSAAEIKDFYKRAAAKRPGQPGHVTDKERTEFEARLALRNAPA